MIRKTKRRAERPKNLFPERDFRGRQDPSEYAEFKRVLELPK